MLFRASPGSYEGILAISLSGTWRCASEPAYLSPVALGNCSGRPSRKGTPWSPNWLLRISIRAALPVARPVIRRAHPALPRALPWEARSSTGRATGSLPSWFLAFLRSSTPALKSHSTSFNSLGFLGHFLGRRKLSPPSPGDSVAVKFSQKCMLFANADLFSPSADLNLSEQSPRSTVRNRTRPCYISIILVCRSLFKQYCVSPSRTLCI